MEMRQILKLVFMLFMRIFALVVFFSSIAEHDTYYILHGNGHMDMANG